MKKLIYIVFFLLATVSFSQEKTYQLIDADTLVRSSTNNIVDLKKKLARHLRDYPNAKPKILIKTNHNFVSIDTLPILIFEKLVENEPIDVTEPIEPTNPIDTIIKPIDTIKIGKPTLWVAMNGKNSYSGRLQENPLRTISFAVSKAKENDIIAVRSGIYSGENIVIKKSGISIIGYKNTFGDIKGFDFKYSVRKDGSNAPFNSAAMPYIKGSDRTKGTGIYVVGTNNITIKNIQVSDYRENIFVINVNDVLVENTLTAHSDGITANYGYGILFSGVNERVVVRGNYSFDNGGDNILVRANNSVIENNVSLGGYGGSNKWLNPDYYIKWRGDNVIVRNNYVERLFNLGHGGHGIGTKAVKSSSKGGKVYGNTVINTSEGIFLAYDKASEIHVYNNSLYKCKTALGIRDGAFNNILRNNISDKSTVAAISFWRTKEEPQITTTAIGNKVYANKFYRTKRAVLSTLNGTKFNDIVSGNVVEDNLFEADKSLDDTEVFRVNGLTNFKDNVFKNNTVKYFTEFLAGSGTKASQWTKIENAYIE